MAFVRAFCGAGDPGQNRHRRGQFQSGHSYPHHRYLVMAWGIVFFTGSHTGMKDISPRSMLFLIRPGAATGLSWLCYFLRHPAGGRIQGGAHRQAQRGVYHCHSFCLPARAGRCQVYPGDDFDRDGNLGPGFYKGEKPPIHDRRLFVGPNFRPVKHFIGHRKEREPQGVPPW